MADEDEKPQDDATPAMQAGEDTNAWPDGDGEAR